MAIYEKLALIKNSVNRIKTALKLPVTTPLEDITNNIEQSGSPESKYFIPGFKTGRSTDWKSLVNNIPPFALNGYNKVSSMFVGYNGDTLDVNITDDTKTTSLYYWFQSVRTQFLDVSKIDTSQVTTLSHTFMGIQTPIIDVSAWDTGKVTNCEYAFHSMGTSSTTIMGNTPVVIMGDDFAPNATNAQYMFYNAWTYSLNLPGLRLPKCTNMYGMFRSVNRATEILVPNLLSDGCPKIGDMFDDNSSTLAKIDIRSFDFTKATSWTSAFHASLANTLIIVKDETQKAWLATNFPHLLNVKTVEEVEPKPSSTPVAILTKGNEDMSVASFTLASDEVVTAFDELNTANSLTPSEDNIYVMGYNMMGEFDVMDHYLYYNGNYYKCNASYVTLGDQLYIASSTGWGECAAIYSGTKDLKPFKLYYLCSDNTYDVGGTYNNETIVVSGTMDETATGVGRYKLTASQRSTVSYLTIDPSFSNWAPESFEYFFYYFSGLKNPDNIVGLEHINMSNCTNINYMFNQFASLHKIDLSFLDISKVTTASMAFGQSGLIPDAVFEKLQTNIIENMSSIFYGATNTTVPVFDVSHATNMYGVFNSMRNLKQHPKLDIPAGASINAMFCGCSGLPVIDVSNIDLTSFLAADANNVNNFFLQSAGLKSLASEGAYADGIPYVYVKDADDRDFILNSMSSNSRPNNWSTSNIIVGSPN